MWTSRRLDNDRLDAALPADCTRAEGTAPNHAALKAEKLRIDNWREKEATRDAVQVTIEDFLWDDKTGLPAPAYSEEDVKTLSRDVYRHIHRVYPTIPSPFYAA